MPITRYQRYVCRQMQFAGAWIMTIAGLFSIGIAAHLLGLIAIPNTPWYSLPFALLVAAGGFGTRWLGRFMEKELSSN
jgi:hypothetical protein